MAKVQVSTEEFTELWVLIGYHLLLNQDKIKSPEVKKLFDKLDKTVKTNFVKSFLQIDTRIRILLKRLLPVFDTESGKEQENIIVINNTKGKDKTKKKLSSIMKNLLAQKEICKSDLMYIKENLDIELAFTEEVKPEKIFLKYI